MDAVCDHLEAVTDGEITRLLINVPPGSSKTTLSLIMWTSWEWGPQNMPHMRYVTSSYSSNLTELACGRTGHIITSDVYRSLWADRFRVTRMGDKGIRNDHTGWILASSVEGVGTGRRGDRVIIDDPNNVKDAESESLRNRANRWFTEVMPDRLNDLTKSAVIVIQQRTHEQDVSGIIIDKKLPYVHLMIPAEYDSGRHCVTVIGWKDPRGTRPDEDGKPDPYGKSLHENERVMNDGELFWPERFPETALAEQRLTKGPYAYAGQYQQSPEPRGGGILKRAWWQMWTRPSHPRYELVIGVLDTNASQKEKNDFSAMVIWGIFQHGGKANAMMAMAWRAKLEINVPAMTEEDRKAFGIDRPDLTQWERDLILNGNVLPTKSPPPEPGERRRSLTPMERARILEHHGCLGLADKVASYCDGYKVDRLLIENKANGFAVDSELRRQNPNRSWSIDLIDPEGKDKTARAHSVVPVMAGGLVWAPGSPQTGMFREWGEMVITECAILPNGKNDDLADGVIHGLRWLRANNILQLAPEAQARADQQRAYENRAKPKPLYPG